MKFIKADFPSISQDSIQIMDKVVRGFITADRTYDITLEQIVASTPKTSPKNAIQVNNTPPVILYSYKPTILLQLEGDVVKSQVTQSDTNLEYVVNSNFSLFLDTTSATYYLYDGLEWQESKAVNGPWAFTKIGKFPFRRLQLGTFKRCISCSTRAKQKYSSNFLF